MTMPEPSAVRAGRTSGEVSRCPRHIPFPPNLQTLPLRVHQGPQTPFYAVSVTLNTQRDTGVSDRQGRDLENRIVKAKPQDRRSFTAHVANIAGLGRRWVSCVRRREPFDRFVAKGRRNAAT